jgi:hypothetical protein
VGEGRVRGKFIFFSIVKLQGEVNVDLVKG